MEPTQEVTSSNESAPSDADTRRRYLGGVKTVVVKLGTQLLNDKEGRLDAGYVATVAHQVATLRERGTRVTVVSSGAIGAGLGELKLSKRPTDLAKLQAVAAVGQRRLMDVWAGAFAAHAMPVAQLLLTREDIDDRTRFLNLRNTIHAVHELGSVPIVNENDTVSTDELVKISFGDNDILAALVAHALRAELLVLLSVVDGILDAHGRPVRLVERAESARDLVRAEKSALGKGGFNSKLAAARMLTESGEALVVADGRTPDVLRRILDGEPLGTLFAPPPRPGGAGRKWSGRSRWIGAARPAGTIVVDDGAVRALVEKNKSLLPAGVLRVEGEFERGDVVSIQSPDGRPVARGLTNYAAEDARKILGKKTHEVRSVLGDGAYDEVVHRDNLVIG
jgi:glutamate 5-kinase